MTQTTAFGTSAYGYRVDGLRIWKKVGASAKRYYLYAGGVPVCELSGTGEVIAINSFGPTGLISRDEIVYNQIELHYFYTFDPLGNVCQIQNEDGGVIYKEGYDAYGSPIFGSEANPTPFGYGGQAGYYTDNETGLILCSARYYDPSDGRWLTRDPIGYDGGLNVYAYCDGNPIGRLDPSGAEREDAIDKIASVSAGMGDTISCNGTALVRRQWARDVFHQDGDLVEHFSSDYAAGETAGHVYNVVSLAVGGAQTGAAVVRGVKAIKAAGGVAKLVKTAKAARAAKPLAAEFIEGSGGEHYVYQLMERETGTVKYIGRTINPEAREAFWEAKRANCYFKIAGRNLNKMEARGLEQIFIEGHGGALNNGGTGLYNKINSINPNTEFYGTATSAAYRLLLP